MPFHLGPWEIALIVLIILIVFGVGKLPEIGNAIGKGIREFRNGQRGEQDEEKPQESASDRAVNPTSAKS